jgi:hypothetical protein
MKGQRLIKALLRNLSKRNPFLEEEPPLMAKVQHKKKAAYELFLKTPLEYGIESDEMFYKITVSETKLLARLLTEKNTWLNDIKTGNNYIVAILNLCKRHKETCPLEY